MKLSTLAATSLLLLAACSGSSSNNAKTTRVVKFRLIPPNSSQEALGGTRPVQLAAVQVEDARVVSVFAGDSVDARVTQTVSAGVPFNASVVLMLQAPEGNASGLGTMVGLITFSDGHGGLTSRVPASDKDLDLGEASIVTGNPSTLGDNRVPLQDNSNPLLRTDRDQDGLADQVDLDDDSDGVSDAADMDADGDGLDDQGQSLGSLADTNGLDDGDGIPDALE